MPQLQAATIDWAHLNGSMSSNGSVTVKSLAGGTYSATQNPTGAVAKASQNAATQPPTVVIQATGSGLPFNYKDDCYYFSNAQSQPLVGAGKLDGMNFTGLVARRQYQPSAILLSMLTGAALYPGNSANIYFQHCGTDAACTWSFFNSSPSFYVIGVQSYPTVSATKCYL